MIDRQEMTTEERLENLEELRVNDAVRADLVAHRVDTMQRGAVALALLLVCGGWLLRGWMRYVDQALRQDRYDLRQLKTPPPPQPPEAPPPAEKPAAPVA